MFLRQLLRSTAVAAARASSHAPWRAAHDFSTLSNASANTKCSTRVTSVTATASTVLTGHGLRSARALIKQHATYDTSTEAARAAARVSSTQRISPPLQHAAANGVRNAAARVRAHIPTPPPSPSSITAPRRGVSSSSSGGGDAAKASSKDAESAAASAASAASAAAAAERECASIKAAWQMYFIHDNAYLNWIRNGLTATAVGMGFVMFRVTRDSATLSLGGICIQAMGVLYFFIGSAQYLVSAFRLQRELRITRFGSVWYVFNAAWPLLLYSTGLRCVHDMHPEWLLEFLAANVESLPENWQGRCMEVVADAQMREHKRFNYEPRGVVR